MNVFFVLFFFYFFKKNFFQGRRPFALRKWEGLFFFFFRFWAFL